MIVKGKVALVTGASRGIGKAVAVLLSERGAKLALVYHSDDKNAEETRNEILEKGTECKIYKCDVSNYGEVQKVVDGVIRDFGRIDILVNNAGIVIKEDFVFTQEQTWDKIIDVNLKGVFNLCRFVIPHMLKSDGGKIVNLSSLAGRNGGTLGIPYAASKAGIIGITKALAAEFTQKGVLVNAVAPGPVYTDLTKKLPEESLRRLEKLSPVGRFAYPEEIAQTIIFLVENDYISGETINVNAGRYMN